MQLMEQSWTDGSPLCPPLLRGDFWRTGGYFHVSLLIHCVAAQREGITGLLYFLWIFWKVYNVLFYLQFNLILLYTQRWKILLEFLLDYFWPCPLKLIRLIYYGLVGKSLIIVSENIITEVKSSCILVLFTQYCIRKMSKMFWWCTILEVSKNEMS